MSFVTWITALSFVASFPHFSLVLAQDASSTASAQIPNPTACGDIILAADADPSDVFYYASAVYDCFLTVPFIDAVAARFVDYYNTTIQFQSTLAYLKNPPATYQQPAVDVLQALEEIKQNVTANRYANQYEFEATLQSLVYQMHDAHVDLSAGILSSFAFGSPYDIVSVSPDGKQPPQVFLADDVIQSQQEGWTPSPVVAINGDNVTDYLTRFAALNSAGTLEAHADWNQLMYSPLQDILGTYSVFGWQASFYPGADLNFTLANGTTIETVWLGIYQNQDSTGPLTTGGDYYNYFVLGLLPASYNASSNNDASIDNTTDTGDNSLPSWYNISTAYPQFADVVQSNLSVTGGGFLTGYFLNDTSTAVLSIPSFDEYADSVGTFSDTTSDFISRAQQAGLTRVVIDLQGNTGGTTLLAINTFNQFFPNIEPFAGSRRRSHYLANILGGAMTAFWDDLTPGGTEYDYDAYYPALAANDWVITDRLNAATGRNFTSWQEYFGPISANGDTFSLVERYNLSSLVFDGAAFDGWAPAGYVDNVDDSSETPPFDAANIVILTDGLCSSSCSLFVEMMVQQGGVRTIAVGGTPAPGPMQTASGSRGAAAWSSDLLDSNFEFAGLVNDTANVTLPQVRDPGIFTYYMGFNLRDQIRQNDTEPLQFKYEAADCRIYYTMANIFNESRLWRDAAAATWDDPSLCVSGSTGYTAGRNSTAPKSPPSYPHTQPHPLMIVDSATPVVYANYTFDSRLSDGIVSRASGDFGPCDGTCTGTCRPIKCPGRGSPNGQACLPSCSDIGQPCGNGGTCQPDGARVESKSKSVKGASAKFSKKVQNGLCFPNYGNPSLGCPATGNTAGGPAPP